MSYLGGEGGGGGTLQLGFRIDGSHELFGGGGTLQLGFRIDGSHELFGGGGGGLSS